MSKELEGAVAVVTGGSKGIGLAVAQALGSAGARVIALARDAQKLAQLTPQLGRNAVGIAADLSVKADVDSALEQIRAVAGVPDIVVSNAGAFELGLVGEMAPAQVERMLALNLLAPYAFFHAFVPGMRERGSGHLVSIGSVADRETYPENAAYSATKFGARAMHQVLRQELRSSGVRIALVSPGPVDTHIWDPIAPESRPGYPRRDEMLDVEAVAAAVLWVVTRPASVNVDELRLSRS